MKQYLLGINVLSGEGVPVIEQMEMIRGVGWDACFTGWEPEHTEAWANAAARLGLVYQSIHSPFGGVARLWREGEEGRAETERLIACVNDCARFDIPVMVIHPFIGFRDHTPTPVGLENYARVAEAADRAGVKLGFENVEGEEYLAALMERFWDAPCCGFCFDTGHEMCYNGGKDMLALYGEKLCHTHCNDNLGVAADFEAAEPWYHDLHLTMGDGIVDWKGVMARIDATPYEGPLMCELTRADKPGRQTHAGYRALPLEDFYAFALNRARRMRAGTL